LLAICDISNRKRRQTGLERQKDKILIVDDVELNRAILCELFAGDYEILEADNGKTL
jgi:CheY-like chemotaxis protein